RSGAGRPVPRPRRAAEFPDPDDTSLGGRGLSAARARAPAPAPGTPRGTGDVKWAIRGSLATGLILLAWYPAVASGYGIRFMLQLLMWVTLAQSWNLISGLTGYVSFGHVAFFGIGAYATGILVVRQGWHWVAASLAGGVTAVVLALVIGYPCLRLKGPYFAIAMLGLNEVMRVVVSYFERLTGGS